MAEAEAAGALLKKEGFAFDRAYTSYLKRAVKTLDIVLDKMDLDWIPVEKSWRLNEKHYGALQGFNKAETAAKYGTAQVQIWRRSFDIAPAPLPQGDKRSPAFDPRYKTVPPRELPVTESLKNCIARTLPYWQGVIWPALKETRQVLVAAHGNSLRGIVKYLKNIPDGEIPALNLPTGAPYVFEFDADYKLVKDYFLGNQEEIKKQMQAVADQGKK
jgi:2,3-bisphosphoglycerate-dependent phosphoglycerate mutase